MQPLKVRVPATTANLGPGFDVLGLALNIYNTVTVAPSDNFSVTVKGEGEGSLPQDETNLLVQAANVVFKKAGYQPGNLSWTQENQIPLQSGMGSSAATIVAGLSLANAVIPQPFSIETLHRLAVEIEEHPDNVTPALYGGLTVSIETEEGPLVKKVGIPPGLHLALAVPDFNLSTARARNALPDMVKREDAVFNVGRVALLLTSLMSGCGENLRWAFEDRLHQPYRAEMIPGLHILMEAVIKAGAQGSAISGAGPTVAAFWIEEQAEEDASGPPDLSSNYHQIASAMKTAFSSVGTSCRVFQARPDGKGAVVYSPLNSL